jgi:cytochrome c peroxidase
MRYGMLFNLLASMLALTSSVISFAQGGPPPFVPLGQPPIPVENPQSASKIMLGMALFWDEQLSKTGTVACGTCHMPRAGGSDARTQQANAGSIHPGPDQVFNTPDDITGSLGVTRHDANGIYQFDQQFGMSPQVGSRQSQSAVNSAYPPLMFWDGRAGGAFNDPTTGLTVIGAGGALENQALGPVVNAVEMAHVGGMLSDVVARVESAVPLKLAPSMPSNLSNWIAGRSYPELFNEVFGTSQVSATRMALAIASYERSLIANQTPHDQQLNGNQAAMTQAELNGRQAFQQAGCARCHGGPQLSDNNFHYIGVRPANADPGRFAVTGNNGDRGRMRTPALRNVELSPPYFADGRFRTLEEVVDFYNRGGDFTAPNKDPRIVPLNLSPQQRAAIVSFLRRPLTDVRVRDETEVFARPQLFQGSSSAPQSAAVGVNGASGRPPRLVALEAAFGGAQDFTIAVDGALAFAPATAVLAFQDPGVGTVSAIRQQQFSTSSDGSASFNFILPDGAVYAGQDLFLRVFVQDASAPGGWASTQSVRFKLLGVSEQLMRNGFE